MVAEYLLATADQYNEEFLEHKSLDRDELALARANLAGKLDIIRDIVGLPQFLKSYKTKEEMVEEIRQRQNKK